MTLAEFFHNKWSLGIIAELHRDRGTKFVTLCRRLGAPPGSMKLNLEILIEAGLVQRNPGYGHPLRPEYILTPAGLTIGEQAMNLMDRLPSRSLGEIKWCLPALSVIGEQARFSEVRKALPGITDRALSKCLRVLEESGVAVREVEASYPPRVTYKVADKELTALLKEFEERLGSI